MNEQNYGLTQTSGTNNLTRVVEIKYDHCSCEEAEALKTQIQRVRELINEATSNGEIYVFAMPLLEALDGEQ